MITIIMCVLHCVISMHTASNNYSIILYYKNSTGGTYPNVHVLPPVSMHCIHPGVSY